MIKQAELSEVFQRLKGLLQPYAARLVVKSDAADTYYLETEYSKKWKKPLFFGSVQIKKNYVSFYLMPVYMYPDLLDGVSDVLRKRMQGKSCFNFTRIDEITFAELAELVNKSMRRSEQELASE